MTVADGAIMSYGNAVGFLLFGLAMWFSPEFAPSWFPHSAVDGSSARALWSQVMGLVQFGLGLAFLALNTWEFLMVVARRALAQADALEAASWQPDAIPAAAMASEFQVNPHFASYPHVRSNILVSTIATVRRLRVRVAWANSLPETLSTELWSLIQHSNPNNRRGMSDLWHRQAAQDSLISLAKFEVEPAAVTQPTPAGSPQGIGASVHSSEGSAMAENRDAA